MVVLFAEKGWRGGGSSQEESNEIPLEGGLTFASLSEMVFNLVSRSEIEEIVWSNKRTIFLKWS